MTKKLMIHFGELYTKGKNRRSFIQKLSNNISHSLKKFKPQIETKHDHIYISNFNELELSAITHILANISGIHAISEVIIFERNLDLIKAFGKKLIEEENYRTFKVITKRKDKNYEMTSDQINRDIASFLLRNTEAKVDIHHPEFALKIELDLNVIVVIGKRYEGLGGYPLGAAGKGLVLLSGGIDSPVAAYLTIRRGIKISAIHFASPPYTSSEVLNKVEQIGHKLNEFQPSIRLYVVPFTKLQLAIYEHCPHNYAITLMRRMMMRIATVVAKRHQLKILVTGESLGQVASQTLESVVVINEVTNYPVIRPLATVDKNEIIKIAKKIETYDISILPYEDCCTIFANPNPVTSPRLDEVKEYEERFDFESLISEAIGGITKVDITLHEEDDTLF